MGNKIIYALVIALIVFSGVYFFMVKDGGEVVQNQNENNKTEEPKVRIEGAGVVSSGSYKVDTVLSEIKWSAGKPLIEGYINSGIISLKEGSVLVGEATTSASFVIDMNTIKVGATPKKPGKESALEGHLKGSNFFDVAKYPTAEFKIISVSQRADSATSLMYDVVGTLTMKGKTNDVNFPASIYEKDGFLRAEAELVIDRTKWGITVGSGSFFDNLADNVIEDEIHLTLSVSAKKVEAETR